MQDKRRAHLIVSGRVQGVFFRVETQRAATAAGVVGWVRNKPDGTVEAVAEGTQANVDALIRWCHKGPAAAKVDRVDVTWQTGRDEFTDFGIRY